MIININLSFINQINKLNLKLVKVLNLVYIYLLIFPLDFVYIIKINKVFFEIIDYLNNYFKGISNIRLISNI